MGARSNRHSCGGRANWCLRAFCRHDEAIERRMKVRRFSALIERDMRKFFRSPALMMSSLIFPLVQLVVLGYAFGGKIRERRWGWWTRTIRSNRGAWRRCLMGSRPGRRHFGSCSYNSLPRAIDDLRTGFVRGLSISLRFFAALLSTRPASRWFSRRTTATSSFRVRCSSAFRR